MSVIDQPREIRDAHGIDRAQLESFLKRQLGLDGVLRIEQFPSGFSNLTYSIQIDGKDWILRRPPLGAAIKSAHDMAREYRVISGLRRVVDWVPKPIALCEDDDVLGAPFYLMERVRGLILRRELPAGLDWSPGSMQTLSETSIDQLVTLHETDLARTGLADLGKPGGYVERQVTGWGKRYRSARTDSIEGVERAFAWLSDHMPGERGATLIHNDYKYDNLVLDPEDPTRIRAVLDWEMATVGCPLMDLGTTLGYWAEESDPPTLKQFGVTSRPGNLNRQGVVERYAESGLDPGDPVFYYVFGLAKVAVIAQQIYARFRAGHTDDPRFAGLIQVVKTCGDLADRAIEGGRISNLFD